jgi:hypothetical protein
VVYEQQDKPASDSASDTGERLIDHSKSPPKVLADAPELYDFAFTEIHERITGAGETDLVVAHKSLVHGPKKDVLTFETEDQFQDMLSNLKTQRKFPIILNVHTANQPFFDESPNGKGCSHVVTVKDYLPGSPPLVLIDNQWDRGADHVSRERGISLHNLFLSTMKPEDSLPLFRKDFEAARLRGRVDSALEFDRVGLEWRAGLISDPADYERRILSTLETQLARWSTELKNGTLQQTEQVAGIEKIGHMTDAGDLPFLSRSRIMRRLHQLGFADDETYEKKLEEYIKNGKKPLDCNESDVMTLVSGLPPDRRLSIIKLFRSTCEVPK